MHFGTGWAHVRLTLVTNSVVDEWNMDFRLLIPFTGDGYRRSSMIVFYSDEILFTEKIRNPLVTVAPPSPHIGFAARLVRTRFRASVVPR